MLRTITIGNYMSVQGLLVAHHADGRISVKVGEKVYCGYPVNRLAA